MRGRGLLIGIEFNAKYVRARSVAEKLLARGILTKETHETVIRLAPPLVVEQEDLAWACDQLIAGIRELEVELASPTPASV